MELNLPVYRFRADFKAQQSMRFPAYAGSTWRGLFGHVLRRSVCVTGAKTCEGCLLSQQCLYRYIFETPPPTEPKTIVSHLTAAPHPFVIRPLATSGATLHSGDDFTIELLLFGKGQQHLPYIIYTLQQMGQQGFNRQRASDKAEFTLTRLTQIGLPDGEHPVFSDHETHAAQTPPPDTALPEDAASSVSLHFITPYRAVQQGKLVRPEQFSARQFLMTLLRRVSLLQAVHTDTPLELDFHALGQQADTLTVTAAALRWHDWQRYSSRQSSLIKMGGLVGSVILEGAALAQFMPLLRKGELTHSGKGAVMGLGQYGIYAKLQRHE